MSGASRILSLRCSGVRGGYSLGAVPVGEGGVNDDDDDDDETCPLEMDEADDAPLEAAWAFEMRSIIA